jgi:uncharacterized protein (DUF1800 family)
VQGQYQFQPDDHDPGEISLLGTTATFDGDALADLILAQPAVADRLAWRLAATFLGERVASAADLSELAARLRHDGLHIGRAVETVLRSERFFSERNLHSRVVDPVGFAIGTARALERFEPPPSTLLLAEWTGRIGQELFFPPNVGGWPGGRSWLTGRAVVARANFAAGLVEGRLNSDATPPDLQALAARRRRTTGRDDAFMFFCDLLLGRRLEPAAVEAIQGAGGSNEGPETTRLNRAVARLLARPEAQLC